MSTASSPHPFFDAVVYPWHRPEAVALHQALYQAVSNIGRINVLYQRLGTDLMPLMIDQPADMTWRDVLDHVTAAGRLRSLLDVILQDSALASIWPVARLIVEASSIPTVLGLGSTGAPLANLNEWRQHRKSRRSADDPSAHPFALAAAVLVDCDPAQLKPFGTTSESATDVLASVGQAVIRNGTSRVALFDDVRRKALGHLARQGNLQSALDANAGESSWRPQVIYGEMIRGKWDYALWSGADQLAAALQATRWLDGLVLGLPSETELLKRLNRVRFLEPFERLAGTGFVGREAELQRLNDFVGINELSSAPEAFASNFRGWLLKPKTGPMLIHGIGGAGKSSLIARFILIQEGARLTFQRFPIVYIDFDNSVYSVARSETLCLEAARQLTTLYPSIGAVYESMRQAIQQLNEKRMPEDEETRIPDFQQSLDFCSEWFPQLLAEIVKESGEQRPPFLFAFDTFEEEVLKSSLAISQLLTLIESLQRGYPELRALIAGRALERSFGDELKRIYDKPLEIGAFDQPAAVAYLRGQGVIDPTLASTIVNQVGRLPLSLKLAAQAIQRGETVDAKSGFAKLRTTSWLVFSVNEAVVQGQLYQRILQHINDSEVRKLAHPGLVLRRLTPEVILAVLAEPCGLALPQDPTERSQRATELFNALAHEVTLVESAGTNALRPRNEIRRVMLSLIERDRPTQVGAIHRAAADYYVKHGSTVEERGEEIYHRLKRGDEAGPLFSSRWVAGVGPLLADSLPEFPAAVQLSLASWAGLKLPNEAELSRAASLEDWERITLRRVNEGLSSRRDPKDLLAILAERSERTEGSPLFAVHAQVLQLAGNHAAAIAELRRGVDSLAQGNNKQKLLQHLQLLGEAMDRAGQNTESQPIWAQALEIARDLDMPRQAFAAAYEQVKANPSGSDGRAALEEALRQLPEADWKGPLAVRAAVELLGDLISADLKEKGINLLPPVTL